MPDELGEAERGVAGDLRLALMRRVAAGIGHEINNQLTGALGHASLMHHSLPEGPHREALARVLGACERVAGTTAAMLAYTTADRGAGKGADINLVVKTLWDVLRAIVPRQISLQSSLDAEARVVMVDPGAATDVLLALCVATAESLPNRPGTMTVATCSIDDGVALDILSPEPLSDRPTHDHVSRGGLIAPPISTGLVQDTLRQMGAELVAEGLPDGQRRLRVHIPRSGVAELDRAEGPP